ncbi:MAG: hypothetical protein K6C35_02570, partial [Eubacterium sp.]|nr:hypothetical protein [Eubacterium sp.]
MKKKLAVFIICIMTIGCLASCGKKDKTDKNTEETKKTGTDVVVGAKTDSYDSVEALTDKAATIVIGKKTGVEKVVSNVDGEGYWINGYTLC